MFVRKRDFLELEEKVKELEGKVSKLQNFKDSLVFCAKCGCAVKRADAYKTPPTVKKRPISVPIPIPEVLWVDTQQEYIHRDYYCKEHAPDETK